MAITINCQCGYSKVLTDFYAGKRVRCPVCATVIGVPTIDKVYDIGAFPDFTGAEDLSPRARRQSEPSHPGGVPIASFQDDPFSHAVANDAAYAAFPEAPRQERRERGQFSDIFDATARSAEAAERAAGYDDGRGGATPGACSSGAGHRPCLFLAFGAAIFALVMAGKPIGLPVALLALIFTGVQVARASALGRARAGAWAAFVLALAALFFAHDRGAVQHLLSGACPFERKSATKSVEATPAPPKVAPAREYAGKAFR